MTKLALGPAMSARSGKMPEALTGTSLEKVTLARQPVAHELEEGAHARGAFQVRMSDDP